MSKAGLTQREIAECFRMSRDTVKSIIGHSKQYSSSTVTKKNGRKPKLSPEQRNHLHKESIYKISVQYRTPSDRKLSISTVRKIPHSNGIGNYVAAVKPY